MKPAFAKIESFTIYPPNFKDRPAYVQVKVLLNPYVKPGNNGGPSLVIDTIVIIDPDKDTISSINKRAAAQVHAAIKEASSLSLEEVERSVSHALEYDEHRA